MIHRRVQHFSSIGRLLFAPGTICTDNDDMKPLFAHILSLTYTTFYDVATFQIVFLHSSDYISRLRYYGPCLPAKFMILVRQIHSIYTTHFPRMLKMRHSSWGVVDGRRLKGVKARLLKRDVTV